MVFRLPALRSNLRKRLVKMPKLHFYDTGLVCWLLGIRNAEQLHSHPLRGPIFETWVASEILKHRTNHAATGDLSFYRDRGGAEVDITVEQPSRLTLVEAKSSATATSALLDGTRRVRTHLAASHPACEMCCVYGGDELQQRRDGWLIPWHLLHEPHIIERLLT